MRQDFFIICNIACDSVDVLTRLPLSKSGERYFLDFFSQAKAYLLANCCTTNLTLGLTKAIDQQTQEKDTSQQTCDGKERL